MKLWANGFFIKAYKLYEVGLLDEAFTWFLRGAKAGNTSCMLWVGILYGDGVRPDLLNINEIIWYKRAWKKHDSTALNNLAIVYKNQRKFERAEKWFKIAIENGDGDSNLELAKMYINMSKPNGIIKDLLEATINSDSATEASIEEAQDLLAKYA